jgi:putative intracellular protease/amidase
MSLDEALTKGPFDVVVLPGGLGGSKQLAASGKVKQVLQSQETAGGFVAAVCAAPSALLAHGIAKVCWSVSVCVCICVCVCVCVCVLLCLCGSSPGSHCLF